MTQKTLAIFFNKLSAYPAILTLLLLLLLTTSAINLVKANSSQQQQGLLQRPADSNGRPQLMVAIYCNTNGNGGKTAQLFHNQYLEVDGRKWRSDRDPSAYCSQDKQEILNYCRKVYPNHDIRNIVESSRPYKIDGWCKLGSPKRRCRTRLTVKPYRCLEGSFQSDALLVPERCLFDHVHNKSICENSDYWNKTGSENCRSKDMKMQSFAMLQPCGLGIFSGVEFVCCPQQTSGNNKQISKMDSSVAKAASSSEGNSFAQAAATSNWPKDPPIHDLDEKFNGIKVEGEVKKQHSKPNEQSELQSESSGQDEQDDPADSSGDDEEEDEYDDDEDEYDDDSSSWGGNKASSTTTSTTTTTTTERPIDHYLSHFDLAHEHDEFRRAELAVEGNYRDKITHVMNEWSQLESHYNEMKKKDPQAAEDYKKKMTRQFQKTIEALEEEGAAQRHQLASMHAERAMAIINRRKKAAMDCLTQALDRIPIRTRQVERCIVKLLKALEKDRTHTLRQYKNLLNLNTREALREKKIILDHLVTLNRAANQSIAMLDRSPILVDKLKSKIVTLWHKLRNVPTDEPIVRESELKIMEAYEEEIAQRKIERERKRLMEQEAIQETPQESAKSGENKDSFKQQQQQQESADEELNSNSVKSISTANGLAPQPIVSNVKQESSDPTTTTTTSTTSTTTPAPVKPQHLIVQAQYGQAFSSRSSGENEHESDIENEIHYQIDSARFAHLKADTSSHHELLYSVKHEPIGSKLRFGYSTFLVSACALVSMLALVGIKYYRKHSTRSYRRQGFAEVGRSCPDEKSVTNLQFNGYENPAYKFYEAEA